MYSIILFDLDGTLTDPKVGITTCVQYALKALGIIEPNLDKLEPFIGPPLKEQFMSYAGISEERAEFALLKYRERFQNAGIYENEIYDGIVDMLSKLINAEKTIALASSKPTVFCERILEHFHIRQYFQLVMGSELNGNRSKKAEVIEEALKQLKVKENEKQAKVLMVGDREHDVLGAREAGIKSVGVTFGYGGFKELADAGADWIVNSVDELTGVLLNN